MLWLPNASREPQHQAKGRQNSGEYAESRTEPEVWSKGSFLTPTTSDALTTKVETECGGEKGGQGETADSVGAKQGAWGSAPFPRNKLQKAGLKPPWAEPRTEKGRGD